MKIGIYSGSFNPVHNGHIGLANYMLQHSDLDEIRLLVSPQNPLKEKDGLLADNLRLEMLCLATKNYPALRVSDIEFSLPKPSYTIDTLHYLQKKYPGNQFVLIIGIDNLGVFDQWKNYRELLADYRILVYPRSGYDTKTLLRKYPSVEYINAPLFDISSSMIRERIASGADVSSFLPAEVYAFIKEKKLYC